MPGCLKASLIFFGRKKARNGFGLLEMVVTLSLLLFVMAAAAQAPYQALQRYRRQAFVQRLATELRTQSHYSRLGYSGCDLVLIREKGAYRAYQVRRNGQDRGLWKAPEGCTIESNVQVFQFTPKGTLQEGGATLRIGSKEHRFKLTIVPISGRVRVYEEKR